MSTCTMQIGKNGYSDGVIEVLKNNFKTHENVRVCLLKSANEDRKEKEEIAKKIVGALGKNYTYKIVGYTIFVKKWRKSPSKS